MRRAPAPAPAPAVMQAPAAEPAPAPAAPMAPMPAMPEQAPAPAAPAAVPSFGPPSTGQWPVSGTYQSSCGNFQVQGTGQTISYRTLLSVSDGLLSVQRAHQFFWSLDCSGSLYAGYLFPAHKAQYLGQRATVLPDNGQTVPGTLLLAQPVAGQVQLRGAVMPLPNNAGMIGVVVNGTFTAAISMNYGADEERLLLHPTRGGLYMINNREPGASNDSQGLPTRFIRGMDMLRVQ